MVRDATERLRAVKKVVAREESVREVAKDLAVTPRTIRNWRKRFLEGGTDALENRSSAPKHVANKLQDDVVRLVVTEKREHPDLGVRRITGRLKEVHGVRIGFKSVHRILQRRGLITSSEPSALQQHRGAIGVENGDGEPSPWMRRPPPETA